MNTRRWARIAVVTTLAVAGTVAVTAAPAQARPKLCSSLLDAIDHDWDEFNNYAAWAGINAHDHDWQDYSENMQAAANWARNAKLDTQTAQNAGCM